MQFLLNWDCVADDEGEHPPPAPLHTGKYHNDRVAVENEIYMAYGQGQQDQHRQDSSSTTTPDNHISHQPAPTHYHHHPHQTAQAVARSDSQSSRSSYSKTSQHHQTNANQHYAVSAEEYRYSRQTSGGKNWVSATGDSAILLVDGEGSSINSDEEDMYLDEATAWVEEREQKKNKTKRIRSA